MLYKRLTFYIIIFFVFHINCAITFKVVEGTDKFNPGVTTITSTGLIIKNVQFFETSFLIMRPYYFFSQESETESFTLHFIYSGNYWAFFDRIVFLINGEVLSYDKVISGDSIVQSDASVGEIIVIKISEELFKKIRSAKTLSLRVSGKRQIIDLDLSQEAIDNLNTFYSYILDFRKKSMTSYTKPQKVNEQNNIEDNFKSLEELSAIKYQIHYLPIENTAKDKYLLVLIDNTTPMHLGDEYQVIRNLGGTSKEEIKEIGFAKVVQVKDAKVALEYFLYEQNDRLLKSDMLKYK